MGAILDQLKRYHCFYLYSFLTTKFLFKINGFNLELGPIDLNPDLQNTYKPFDEEDEPLVQKDGKILPWRYNYYVHIDFVLRYENLEKEYQNENDYRSDEECAMFYKQLKFKFDRLKQVIERKLTWNYTSTFEKFCVFRVYEVTRFLKHLSNEFNYERISYSELPIFYEVKKTNYSRFLGTAKTYGVEIYGYHIKSKESVTISLQSKIIEFWQKFKKMQTEGVTKLFSVNILPTFLLRQIIQIAKGKINDLDTIKLTIWELWVEKKSLEFTGALNMKKTTQIL